MQQSSQPTKIQVPFASSGQKNTIPVPSQASTTPGAASFADGFPSLTMQSLASGGVPPSGKDFNGILNMITGIQQWQCGGGQFTYDSAWSSANGGYPKGALLVSADGTTEWLCVVDGNTTNPDATDGTAANWVSIGASGVAAITGLTNANVTLTPAQYGKRIITLAGTLTGNINIVLPTNAAHWVVVNNTTGNFTITLKTASGTGVTVAQGSAKLVFCDGTNIQNGALNQADADARYAALAGSAAQAFSVAAGVAATQAPQIGQVQNNGLVYAADTGAANAYTVALAPAVTALVDGQEVFFKAKTANTGASTLKVNALTAYPLVGASHQALQGGEIIVNSECVAMWSAALSSFILMASSGGTLPVAAGTQSNHAVNFGQFANLLAANGYQKLPGGNIRQWGTFQLSASGTPVTVNFPTSFVSACYAVVIIPLSTVTGYYNVNGAPLAASFSAVQQFSGTTSYLFIAEGK